MVATAWSPSLCLSRQVSRSYTVCSRYLFNTQHHSKSLSPLFHFAAPCLPENIITTTDCDSNILTTSWDPAAGALLYSVEALGNSGRNYYCNTSSTSCVLSDVSCGEFLSVWLMAFNENCSSGQVLGNVAQSGMYCTVCHAIYYS